MAEIIADVGEQTWSRAVRRFMAEVNLNEDWLDNLVVDGRYAWKLFLNLPENATVLDLGCGLGNLTKNIVPHVAHVCALDLTWERLQFARRRFALCNQSENVTLIAGGDGRHLPFAAGTFDCVILSGVLEWVPDDNTLWSEAPDKATRLLQMLKAHWGAKNPRNMQVAFLKEIHRILKASGQVFIGIENRLDYEYFNGMADHHSGVRYTSLLPRSAATLYSIARAHVPYRTYTYSHSGYRRLLEDAGYDRSQFLGLTPGYSHLAEIIPFDFNAGRWKRPQASNLKERIKRSKRFIPAYGIVGSKSRTAMHATLLDRVVLEIEDRMGLPRSSMRFSSLKVTGRAKAIMRATLADREVFLRIALNEAAVANERANHSALITIARLDRPVAHKAPTPLLCGAHQNVPYYVEGAARGTAMDVLLRSNGHPQSLEGVADALKDLDSAASGPRSFDETLFSERVETPLRELARWMEAPHLVEPCLRALHDLLLGTPLVSGLEHGDFNPENLFADGGEVTGIVDWEHWSARGIPLLDAINFVDGALRIVDAGRSLASSMDAIIAGDLAPAYGVFLEQQYRARGCDQKNRAGYVYLYWLQHVWKQRNEICFDPKAIEARVTPLLHKLATLA